MQASRHVGVAIAALLVVPTVGYTQDDDRISGSNSFIFRSFNDRVFRGTDYRTEIEKDNYTIYDFLNIRRLDINEGDGWRVFGSGSGWLRQDLGDTTYGSHNRMDLNYGWVQLDRGRPSSGFLRLGRLYNYQGVYHQRFDGGELYYPLGLGFDLDVYGGRRPETYVEDVTDAWLNGGRFGYRFQRRNTIGISWLLSHADHQWDDQKVGGDWTYTPWRPLELSGSFGYDVIASDFYEVEAAARLQATHDLDLRFTYDHVIPGLLIPKSSIFSVYSLAEENLFSSQLIYHPGDRWTFLADAAYIDYSNDGGAGLPTNFFTNDNDIDGGHQWRAGCEIACQYNRNGELAVRYERMLEAEYGYTVTDLIRTNFDFRDYDLNNPPPEDEGFVYGELENGFSSFSVSNWHRWTGRFRHAIRLYYYHYDNPLFLQREGDDSWTTNLAFTYDINTDWHVSVGGRYIDSLADREGLQSYLRVVKRF